MPNSGKYIKALHITTDRIGENLAGHVRWRETVARITLDVIGIVFNTAHLWLQRCGNALRISSGVIAEAAKQHSPVG